MSRRRNCGCEPEEIFELADRSLTPDRERRIREHLERCPECYEVYKREKRLNSCLKTLSFSEPRSVREGVAMALPTRPVKARLLWTLLAGVLLSTALFALNMNGVNPAAFVVNEMTMFWSPASMLRDLLGTVLAVAGSALLIALAVGALLDLLLAVILMTVVRRRTRQV